MLFSQRDLENAEEFAQYAVSNSSKSIYKWFSLAIRWRNSISLNKPMNSGPLCGLKIIEFEGIGPAPLAGQLLSDLGADVVKNFKKKK